MVVRRVDWPVPSDTETVPIVCYIALNADNAAIARTAGIIGIGVEGVVNYI